MNHCANKICRTATLSLAFLCGACFFTRAVYADAAGDWVGTLVLPQGRLNFVLLVTGPDNALQAVVDSPDQNEFGLAVNGIRVEGDSLSFTMNALDVQFSATVAGDLIRGTFHQRGSDLPLTLMRIRTGAPCTISEAELVRLNAAENAKNQPYYEQIRGLIFDEAGCTTLALNSFRTAVAALGASPPSDEIRPILTEGRAMLQLETARELAAKGQTQAAVSQLGPLFEPCAPRMRGPARRSFWQLRCPRKIPPGGPN